MEAIEKEVDEIILKISEVIKNYHTAYSEGIVDLSQLINALARLLEARANINRD